MRCLRSIPASALLIGAGLALFGLHSRAGAASGGVVDASSPPQVLQWTACPDIPDTECAGLDVPIDPARPDGQRFTLRLGRLPALDSTRRKGVLLFIPGGPGPGIGKIIGGDSRRVQHIDEFRRRWDVVSFDPRGIEQSSPVRCSPDLLPRPIAPVDRLPTAAEFEVIAHANAVFIESCVAATGELMRHLSAMDTAADIERIRQALSPNDGLVAYAGSYGSQYAQAYLERYGAHVKALVLDGVMDHSIDLPTFSTRNVLAVQDAFERFVQWCDQDSACALHGQDVARVFDAAATAAPATRILISQFLATGPDPDVGWPAIAQMLSQLRAGNASKLDELAGASAAFMSMASDDPWLRAGKDGLFRGVLCADYGPQPDYTTFAASAEAAARRAPRFAWKFWDATPIAHGTAGVGDCVGWPFEARNPPHRLRVGSHPDVLVANTTHDPPTPLVNALSVWLQIPDARLLIADVDGHQSLIFSRCAFEAIARFLDSPRSVATTTLCVN